MSIVKKLASKFTKVIVLPSTYELSQQIENCTYFRRDGFESKEIMPHAIFCHDMAFYLDYDTEIKGMGDGYFFRQDAEASGKIQLSEENFDISSKSNHYGELDLFFDTVARHKTIHTDRLHVAIAGAILKRKVNLHIGSYFKIRAVYLSTFKKYFKNVNLVED